MLIKTPMKTMSNPLRVALLYNLKHPATLSPDAPPDALSEYDTMETVLAVEEALRTAGHHVIPLEADQTVLDSIRQVNPDICFNMAHGTEGPNRESQIPALLDLLDIPYTGSSVATLAMSHNKAMLKRLWRERALPTAPDQVLHTSDEELDPTLNTFPIFVKPLYGRAGMGVNAASIVYNPIQLQTQVERIQCYDQPALVEQYLPGREFVVGIFGDPSTASSLETAGRFNSDDNHQILPILEIHAPQRIDNGVFSAAIRTLSPENARTPIYSAPANLSPTLEEQLTTLAIAAFDAVNAVDFASVDLRLDGDGRPNLLSINLVPNLHHRSSLVQMATTKGLPFTDLVNMILDLALVRYSLAVHSTAPPLYQVEKELMPAPFSCADQFLLAN